MSNKATLVMYHRISDDFTIDDFNKQLDYFCRYYTVISPIDFINALVHEKTLPKNSILLTFDDGYLEHYELVYPTLLRRNMEAMFFPIAKIVLERKLITAEKVKIIFKSDINIERLCYDTSILLRQLNINTQGFVKFIKSKNLLASRQELMQYYQRNLVHRSFSEYLIDKLFDKYSDYNEADAVNNNFLTLEQLYEMKKSGMYIGCHSYNHFHMDELKYQQQCDDIDKALKLINMVNQSTKAWIMCYPYGGYDNNLISVIKSRGCIAGLTVEKGICILDKMDSWRLPRFDARDFPVKSDAGPCSWTKEALTDIEFEV